MCVCEHVSKPEPEPVYGCVCVCVGVCMGVCVCWGCVCVSA